MLDGGPALMSEASVKVGVLVNPESNTMCIFASEL